MASLPTLRDGIALTHSIVAADVERATRFYSDVLGGEIVLAGEPSVVTLANSWITIDSAADHKRQAERHSRATTASLSCDHLREHPRRRHPSRLPDLERAGAHFLTPPIDRRPETRCYLRDPDGHLIEIGQSNKTDRSTD